MFFLMIVHNALQHFNDGDLIHFILPEILSLINDDMLIRKITIQIVGLQTLLQCTVIGCCCITELARQSIDRIVADIGIGIGITEMLVQLFVVAQKQDRFTNGSMPFCFFQCHQRFAGAGHAVNDRSILLFQIVQQSEDGERKRYMAIKANERKQQTEDESRLLKQAESRLAELETIISKTYEERMLGKLPEDLSTKMLEKYTAEQRELTAQAEQYRKARAQEQQDEQDVERFIQRLKKWSDVECLTRELCLDLIEFIVVYARPEEYGAPRKIDIYYKFISKPLADSRNLLLPQNCVEIHQS